MGCDIHAYCEFRRSEAAAWELYQPLRCPPCLGSGRSSTYECALGRNYALFSILNDGVRNAFAYQSLVQERGIPPDASLAFSRLAEDGDAHSHSWLDVDELVAALVHGEHHFMELGLGPVTKGFYATAMVPTLLPMAEEYGSKNVRLVFFFDN